MAYGSVNLDPSYAYDLAASKSRTATLVVAASDSSVKANTAADYVCDGTSDQTEINDAISALPAGGGKIVLLEGTYNINDKIIVSKANVTIQGMGMGATVIQRGPGDGIDISGDNCTLCDITVRCSADSIPTGKYGIAAGGNVCVVNNVEASGFAYGITNGGTNMMVS